MHAPTPVLRARLAGLLVAALLLVGAAAPEVDDPAGPAPDETFSAHAVLNALNDVLAWYRQARVVMRAAADAGIGLFAREGEELALRLLQRAFDAARAKAVLVRGEDPSDMGVPPGEARERLEAEIRQEQEVVARLRARLQRVPRSQRAAIERDLMAASNRLELARARLDFIAKLRGANGPIATGDPDLVQQIQALQATIPDLRTLGAPPAVVAPAEPAVASDPGSATWSLLRRLLALRRTYTSLEELAVSTSRLSRGVEADLRAVQARLKPVAQRLQELTRDPSGSDGTLPQGAREFRELLDRGKALAAATVALRQQAALADRYVDEIDTWERALNRQMRQVLQSLAVDVIRVLAALAAVFVAAALWRIAVRRYVTDVYRQRLLLGVRKALVVVATVLILIFHFTSELATLVTVLGFAAAGIAFALQNVILSVAGYFSMAAPNGIRVGDRVSLQGPFGYVHGEVIEIGLVRMKLRELTGDPVQPTGRIVVFPNSVVFTGTFFKDPPAQPVAA